MRKSKIFVVLMIVVVMVLSEMAFLIGNVHAETINGNEGTVNWSFDSESGVLTFSGSGEIGSLWTEDVQNYPNVVKKIIIKEEITDIGEVLPSGALKALTSIEVDSNNNNLSSENGVVFNKEKTKLIVYPTGLNGAYNIPSSVTSIERCAFYGCTGLTSIEIPDSVVSIGNYTFNGCTGLESINVSNDNSNYSSDGKVLFNKEKTELLQYALGLNGEYIIPNSVTHIESSAFSGCTGLTSIVIPNSVTSIGLSAFEGCTGLTSIEIPNSVTSIGGSSFYKCTGLTSIEIPNSVTSIGSFAFCECTGLTSIEIPNSVTSIGGSSFYKCTGLTSIEIPNSVTSIKDWAFSGCTSLTSINVAQDNSNYSSDGKALFNKEKTKLLQYATGLDGEYIIPNSVISISSNAFHGCTGLTSIEIPNSVTSIEDYAFRTCPGLTSIIVAQDNSNYSSDGKALFNKEKTELLQYAPGLNGEYNIPNSVTSMGKFSFCKCTGLTSIEIPNSVTSIEDYTFEGCTGLTNIEIPNNVTSIGSNAFCECTGLTSIEIPNNVRSIAKYVFDKCTGLNKIIIQGENIEIEDKSFDRISESATIYCHSNSTAVQYAQDHNINCVTDDEAPTITSATQEGKKITIQASDNENGVGLHETPYSIDGETWYTKDADISVNENGEYTVHVRDALLNESTSEIIVDVDAPTITKVEGKGLKIRITASDEGSGLAEEPYSIDGTNWQSSNEITLTKAGTYTVYVRDSKGNIARKNITIEEEKTEETGDDNPSNLGENPGQDDENQQPGNQEDPKDDKKDEDEYEIIDDRKDDKKDNEKQDEKDDKQETKDTTKPTISKVSLNGYKLKITAEDKESGLAEKAYSLDEKNWQESNIIELKKDGQYVVYVRDKAGNIASKVVKVTLEDINKGTDTTKTDDKTKDSTKTEVDKVNKAEDATGSNKAFGQYGSEPVVIFLIAIALLAGVVVRKKLKKMKF